MNGVQLRLPVTAAQPMSTGHAAGDAAPHDVLRRAALEDEAVEDDVEQDRAERQRRGEPVREEPEPGDRCRAEGVGEDERLAVGELAGDERATLRVRFMTRSMSRSM